MLGRIFIVLSLVVYLIVIGCVMSGRGPALSGVAHAADESGVATVPRMEINAADLPYRGVAIQLQRIDWIDRYKESINEIAAIGADTVSLVVDARQENTSSTRIYIDQRITPSGDQLIDLVKHAKSKKLRVMLMPIVLLDAPRNDNEWRGRIEPDNWESWWDSYRAMIGHYAWLAQSSGVDILVVGSELVSTENKESQWKRTIAEVRRTFKGKLTYSSNWDHYAKIPFWEQLDLIGMNSYWHFASGGWKTGREKSVTVEQIMAKWKEIQGEVLTFTKSKNMPLLFTEVGWCSMANMAHEPWDYTKTESDAPTDSELQRKLYEAYFRSWHGNPGLGGFMVWEWTPGEGGVEDRGYTPENKPAEKVLRDWFAKPWK